jgi:hypothetical protein
MHIYHTRFLTDLIWKQILFFCSANWHVPTSLTYLQIFLKWKFFCGLERDQIPCQTESWLALTFLLCANPPMLPHATPPPGLPVSSCNKHSLHSSHNGETVRRWFDPHKAQQQTDLLHLSAYCTTNCVQTNRMLRPSATNCGSWSAHWIGGWIGPQSWLEIEKSHSCWESNPDCLGHCKSFEWLSCSNFYIL